MYAPGAAGRRVFGDSSQICVRHCVYYNDCSFYTETVVLLALRKSIVNGTTSH